MSGRRLLTLLPMAYTGKGPAATCVNLLGALARHGIDCALHLDLARRPIAGFPTVTTLPGPLAFAPYQALQRRLSPRSERRYLRALRPGDAAYLWPTVSLATHRVAKERGATVILEGINTRMASARTILDAAYAEIGAPPGHGITDARIVEEDEKLRLADFLFCPSPAVEQAAEAFFGDRRRLLGASYGVALDPEPPAPPRPAGQPFVALFVGSVCVRKGAHKLLQAWAAGRPPGGELWLVGDVEPVIKEKFGDLLNAPGVRCEGFVTDVDRFYRRADAFVLPSLEEGDPLVTYEAARHGLPLVVSPMGAGRMGAEERAHVCLVDPLDADAIAAALRLLAAEPERRAAWGARMRAAVRGFSWDAVGARRAALLRERLGAGAAA